MPYTWYIKNGYNGEVIGTITSEDDRYIAIRFEDDEQLSTYDFMPLARWITRGEVVYV